MTGFASGVKTACCQLGGLSDAAGTASAQRATAHVEATPGLVDLMINGVLSESLTMCTVEVAPLPRDEGRGFGPDGDGMQGEPLLDGHGPACHVAGGVGGPPVRGFPRQLGIVTA